MANHSPVELTTLILTSKTLFLRIPFAAGPGSTTAEQTNSGTMETADIVIVTSLASVNSGKMVWIMLSMVSNPEDVWD